MVNDDDVLGLIQKFINGPLVRPAVKVVFKDDDRFYPLTPALSPEGRGSY